MNSVANKVKANDRFIEVCLKIEKLWTVQKVSSYFWEIRERNMDIEDKIKSKMHGK